MRKKIFLVEEHDGLRRLMGIFLSQQFEVVSAKTGLEAMGWLSSGIIPAAIVTDDRHTKSGDVQLLTNLRCSGLFADIPVIVLGSDNVSESSPQELQKLGIRSMLRKPFDPMQLQHRLLEVIA